jgi:putative ATPase
MHLRNAPTRLMKELGHGKGYRYAHDEQDAFAAGETYLPDGLAAQHWYRPTGRGLEQRIGEKLAELRARNQQDEHGEQSASKLDPQRSHPIDPEGNQQT